MAIETRFFGRHEAEHDGDRALLAEIREICKRIDNAYSVFEMQSNSDLVEASIYEIESLKARFRYLNSLAREKNLVSDSERSYLKWE